MRNYQIQVYLSRQRKYKWVNTYCTNKKDAQAILRQYQSADIEYKLGLRESQLPDNDIPILSKAKEEYLNYVKTNQELYTYDIKRIALDDFVELIGNNVKLSDMNVDDKKKYLNYLSTTICRAGAFKGKSGLTDSSKNMKMRCIMSFLYWCMDEMEWITKLPFKLKQIKVNNPTKLITPSTIEKILANEPNEVLRSYYRLAYCCGMRRCEINHSELTKDINGQDVLLITKTKDTKNKPPRDVPVTLDLINDWQRCKSAQYLDDRITKGFNRACRRAGVYVPYQTTLHACRHSYATNEASIGKTLVLVQKEMGHKIISTTQKYADATREMYVRLRKENEAYA